MDQTYRGKYNNPFIALKSETASITSDPIEDAEEFGVDDFDLDDFGDVDLDAALSSLEKFAEDQGSGGFLDEVEGDLADYFDVVGAEIADEHLKSDFKPHVTDPIDFQAATRKISTYNQHGLRYQAGSYFITEAPYIKFINSHDECIVGKMAKSSLYLDAIEMIPCILASAINESGEMKGTGLGFSSFVHSCAINIIARKTGLIEPLEGFDYIDDGFTHEITGLNWEKRSTKADFVWNKYALCEIYADLDQDILMAMDASLHEDQGKTDYFVHGAFDQEDSPYTPFLNKLHDLTTLISNNSLPQIAAMVKHWITSRPADFSRDEVTVPDVDIIESAIIRGSKKYNDYYVPAPFRVMAGVELIGLDLRQYQFELSLCEQQPPTHFHTLHYEEDPTQILLAKPEYGVPNPFSDYGLSSKTIFGACLNYSLFQSIYIESELLSKITMKKGCFWSIYSNCGIAWKMVRANSLTYYACYYRIGDPGIHCGKWRCIDDSINLWSSPNFKISMSDISYAKVLPYRIFATVMSTMAYCKQGERSYIIRQVIRASATAKWSTWQTSALAGDFRFFTLCAISGSGDLAKMSESACSKVIKPITFPDFYMLRLLLDFAKNPQRIGSGRTPFFDLPIRFASIEKDLALTHMWHIRKADHATQCFTKLAEGIRKETVWRPYLIECYKLQVEFLSKLITRGCTQNEFNELMSKMPPMPYYNHVLFLGLSQVACATLDAGRRQESTGFNLSTIMSDHHCIYINKHDKLHNSIIKSPRVADGIVSVLSEYGQPEGIHLLLLRMNKGSKIHNIYTIHPKDSKSKNREIPQMTSHMRIAQFFSESMITVYTDAEETDMMQTPSKYSDFVSQFSNIMRKGGLSRSEDKSFFCGHMHPECMSLSVHCVAKVLGSPSLYSSSSILRCDKSRWTALPPDASDSVIEGCNERTIFVLPSGKKLVQVYGVKNYIHFMQGVRACGGALVNTVFSVGLDLIQKERCPFIEITSVMTTSDDSARAVVANRNSPYNVKSIHSDYINLPISLVGHCMMKDSSDKPILSTRIAEFNNVATGPNGMIPQTFVHGHLALQPLNGDTFVDDLINVISSSRMSISWGDSIDLARSVYDSNLICLSQRWQLTSRELDGLFDAGIIPSTDEQLLMGKFCYSRDAKIKLLSTLRDDIVEDIAQGTINILDGLRSFRVVKTGKAPNIKKVHYDGPIERLKIVIAQINAGRKVRGRKAAQITRPINYTARVAAKNKFIKVMLGPVPRLEDDKMNLIELLPDTPDAFIIHTRPRYSDMAPCMMGQLRQDVKQISFKNVFSKRITGIDFAVRLKEDEQACVDMSFTDLMKQFNLQQARNDSLGLRYKSPGGRPQTRFYNGKVLSQAYTMSFTIDIPDGDSYIGNYTQDGISYPTFQVCFWGNQALTKAKKANAILAFGYAIVGSEINVFFQIYGKRVQAIKTGYVNESLITIKYYRDTIYCPVKKNLRPIIMSEYGVDYDKGYDRNFGGDPDAVMNYGNYFNTSSRSANLLMKEMYKSFRSDFPWQIVKYKPSYPLFVKESTKIETAKVNKLVGNRSVCYLELTYCDKPEFSQVISLHEERPCIIKPQEEEEELVWE